jgi:hypothetical protein
MQPSHPDTTGWLFVKIFTKNKMIYRNTKLIVYLIRNSSFSQKQYFNLKSDV